MKRFLYATLFLLTSGTLLAQTGSVTGNIKTSDGQPAAYVNVSLKGTSKGATTDTDGNFKIEKVKAGSYTVLASFVGLVSKTQEVQVSDSQEAQVSFTLEEDGQELKEIVVTANPSQYVSDYPSISLRLKTPLLETAQNIQVVNSQVLKDQQIFDMREGVIRNVSGATQSEHWETYARIVMRGARITAFRNGMNVSSSWGPVSEDMSVVDRIEFVKGPASFMLAAGEPSGFYNIVTKKPTGVTKAELGLSVGSFGTYRGTLDFDGKLDKEGKILYRLNLAGQQKGTHRKYEFSNRATIAPVIKFQINPRTSLTLEYTLQHISMSPIGGAYSYSPNGLGDLPAEFSTLEPNMRETMVKDQSVFVMFTHAMNDNWRLTGQLAYQRFDQVGESLWPTSFQADTDILNRSIGIWDALGFVRAGQLFVNGDVQTGPIKHRILAGVDLGDNSSFQDYWQSGSFGGPDGFHVYDPVYGTVPGSAYPVFDRSRDIRERGTPASTQYTGLYLQDEIHMLKDKLRVILGARYTDTQDVAYLNNTIKDRFTPRLGASYSITKNTSAYALFDNSFIPQPGVMYDGTPFKPLIGENLEVGLKRDWLNGQWTATLAGYQIVKNNVLTNDPDHQFFSLQVGETRTRGIEFDIRGQIFEGFNVTANYAFTDGKTTKDQNDAYVNDQIAGTDKHIANAWIRYQFQNGPIKGLGLSLGASHAAGRTAWYGAYNRDQDVSMPSYTRFDAAIAYQLDKVSISLNVNNMFDAKLISGAYYEWSQFYYFQTEAMRNYRLSVGYKF
jgi:iron complex outermembrane receptor protein